MLHTAQQYMIAWNECRTSGFSKRFQFNYIEISLTLFREILTDNIWYKDVQSHKTPMTNMLKMKPLTNSENRLSTLKLEKSVKIGKFSLKYLNLHGFCWRVKGFAYRKISSWKRKKLWKRENVSESIRESLWFSFSSSIFLSFLWIHSSSICLKMSIKSRMKVSTYQQIPKNNVFIKQMIPPIMETANICMANVTAYPIPIFWSNGILTLGKWRNFWLKK